MVCPTGPPVAGTALARLVWLLRPDAIRSHHLIVLVLHNVAMPDELTGRIKLPSYPRHLTRVRDDCVFEAGFPGLARFWSRRSRNPDFLSFLIHADLLPVDDFDSRFVKMHWMGIACCVVHLPCLRRPDGGVLCDAIHP